MGRIRIMANQQDLVRLLTGISGTQQPVQPAPVAGSKNFAGMFGAQQAAKLSGGIQNLARGGAPSPQQNIASAISNIDLKSAEGLRTMAQVKQIQGDIDAANALNQQADQQEKIKTQKEQKSLRALSMATALKEAGHEELAKQVELGDAEAYKRGLELISPEQGKTSVEDIVDTATGVTHKVVVTPEGTIVRTIGVSKMPTLKSVALPNGQLVWENEVTGTRSEPQDTPEALEQDRERIEKLSSDLAAVDNVLLTVTEARELSKDPTGTGVLYNIASLGIGTSARELAGKISTLQSTLAFDRLQKMRDNSKTGGALGQVSNIELQLLQNSLTALDPIVGKEAFEKQLQKVEKHYNNFRKALLGQPVDIDWSQPAYKGKTTVVDGVRYMLDPTDPTKIFSIGKE